MVKLIVIYESPIKEVGEYKEPNIPEHEFRWRKCRIKTIRLKTGEMKQNFEVESEMEDTELVKIKDSVTVIKVMQL